MKVMNIEFTYEELRLLRVSVETEIIRREESRRPNEEKLAILNELNGRLSACIHDFSDCSKEV